MIRLLLFCTLNVVTSAIARAQVLDHSVSVRRLVPEERGKEHTIAVSLPLPEYPRQMLRSGIVGEATFRFLVREDGTVTDVSVVKSTQSEFSDPAKQAVARWRFQTVTDRDVPVAKRVWMSLEDFTTHLRPRVDRIENEPNKAPEPTPTAAP